MAIKWDFQGGGMGQSIKPLFRAFFAETLSFCDIFGRKIKVSKIFEDKFWQFQFFDRKCPKMIKY